MTYVPVSRKLPVHFLSLNLSFVRTGAWMMVKVPVGEDELVLRVADDHVLARRVDRSGRDDRAAFLVDVADDA